MLSSSRAKLVHLMQALRACLGIERNSTSHSEKLVSALGAMVGILCVYWVSAWLLDDLVNKALIVASMGASAVLLFAVPHGALSQPWAVVGGHLISATLAVTCYFLLPEQRWAGALAVGVAVGAMYYLRCIHPPGGATALSFIIGGSELQSLGYGYVLAPVLVNVLLILAVAVIFNWAFPWRRYPAHLARRHAPEAEVNAEQRQFDLTQEDFEAALEALDSYVDLNSESLVELLELAKEHAEKSSVHPPVILAGRYYSNGRLGRQWSVREVLETSPAPLSTEMRDQLRYRVVAGDEVHEAGMCAQNEFREWARFEVTRQNGRWIKATA